MKEILQRGAVGVATLLTVDVLGGCTTAPTPEPAPPTTVQVDPELERQTEYYEGPKGPCLEVSAPSPTDIQGCLDMQKNTRIALVNFDFTSEEAQVVAQTMKVPFDRSTNGVFNAQPVVVPASEAAKKEAKQWNPGCVDSFMDFASLTAQIEMPDELSGEKFDMVIALTKATACEGGVAGLAERSRYADILAGGLSWEMTPSEVGYAVAHEAGHNVGFGHVRQARCPVDIDVQDPAAGPLDLDAYLQGCEQAEYSNSTKSMMGNAFNKREDQFAAEPAQLPDIMWPQKALTGESMLVEATPQGVSLGIEEAHANKLISVPIPYSPNSAGVDSLIIAPEVDESDTPGTDYPPRVWGGSLFLHDGDNDVTPLGYVAGLVPGDNETRVLQFQGKTVTISIAGGRIAVASV